MFASLFSSVFSGTISGILKPVLGFFEAQKTTDLDILKAGATSDTERYKAYLDNSTQMATLAASQNQWWGARLIILMTAGSAGLHLSSVMLDSVPFVIPFITHHIVGSWGIPKLPAPYDDYEWQLVKSFIIMTPLAPVLTSFQTLLHRK